MKYCCLLFMLVVVKIYSNAQVHRFFFNTSGKTVKDSKKAVGYILFKKIEQDSDYLWSFAKYDMNNVIMEKGTCLDSELNVKHGKFIYYQKVIHQQSLGKDSSSLDTEVVRKAAGYYLNNKMEGVWLSYFLNGNIASSSYFENGLREGLFKVYYSNGALQTEGYHVNNAREGDWYTFNRDSSVLSHSQFKHSFLYNYEEYSNQVVYNAYPVYRFNLFIFEFLKKLGYPLEKKSIMLNFTITKEGKLTDPEIKMGINPSIDESIKEAIKSSPTWIPAKINKKKTAQRITFLFTYDGTNLN